MALSSSITTPKPSILDRIRRTAFAACLAFVMLLGSAANAKVDTSKTKGSAGGSHFGAAKSAPSTTSADASIKGVKSPEKMKPTKNVATTIKEGADGSKKKVVTTTTTDENGKKTVTSDTTIIKAGNPASHTTPGAAAPAAAPAPAAAGPTVVHVVDSGPAPSAGGFLAGAAIGAAVGSMAAPPPPAPWYNPWAQPPPMMQQPVMGGMPMQQPMPMAPTYSPFGYTMGLKTLVISSIFLSISIFMLILLFRR